MKILMDMIETIYLNHTFILYNELDTLLKKDIWLNAETCLKYGLVDEIL
jgi:ATP-dependent protease ClpP protease subunit